MASMISEVKFDLRLETSSLKHPDIHGHIASDGHLGGLGGYGGHKMNSEVKADLKIELSDLNYLCSQGRMIEIVNPHQIANCVRPYLQ